MLPSDRRSSGMEDGAARQVQRRAFRLYGFGLLGVACVLAVAGCVWVQRGNGEVELLHMGALTQQEDMQAAAQVQGRYASDYAPLHRAMFSDTEPAKPLVHGVVSTNLLPSSHKARKAPVQKSGNDLDLGIAEHSDDARKFQREVDSAEETSRQLSNRDASIEESADEGASSLLKSYDDAINSGVDEYDRMSKEIDEKARRAFLHLPEPKKQARHPRRPAPAQHEEPAAAAAATPAAAGDPLNDQKSTWKKMGVHGPLLGVPSEYQGEHDVTGGERQAVADLPWYVKQAHKDLQEAAYVRERRMPKGPTMLSQQMQKKRLDSIEREAKAPLLKVKKGTSLQQVVSSAVSAALAKNPQYSQLQSQRPRDVMRFKLSYNSGDTSAQPAAPELKATVVGSNSGRQQQLVQERDAQDPVTSMPDPAKTVNQMELPSLTSHDVASSMFHMEMKHLDNQMDAIYGPPVREQDRAAERARRIAAVKALAQRFEGDAPKQQQMHAVRTRQYARVAEHKERPVRSAAVKAHEQVDSAVKKTEKIEIAKLKAEVKKMREQARLNKLKAQVKKLRHQVLANEHHEEGEEGGEEEGHAEGEEGHGEGEHEEGEEGHEEGEEEEGHEEGHEGEEGEEGHEEGEEGEEGHEEGEEGEEGEEEGEEGEEGTEEEESPCNSPQCRGECDKKCADKIRALFAPRKVKVCNSMGCTMKTVPAAKPPHPLTPTEWEKSAFEGDDEDFLNMVLPGANLDPEVHLNKEGEIRADHDDPNGKLMPHNKYQEARYPDGKKHERGEVEPGITNSVGLGLFADNIVPAAPGFNAGTGRHVRAQEAADYARNWETQRESKKGRDEDGKPWVVG